jgi:23S rRNA pseudouridine1911/1915/1917 synthase
VTPDEPIEPSVDDVCEMRCATLPAALHGLRLDKTVVWMASEFSRNHLQSLIQSGHVRVDGIAQATPAHKVRAGQRVEVELVPTAESMAFRAEAIPLEIVFEDEHLLVVDKPSGLVVHPAAGHWSGTLLNALLAHHADAARLPRAGIVHRLDKDTSGLMVVGKSTVAVTALSRQIAAREVHREYLAICHGRFGHQTQRIDAPIGRDPRSRVKMAVVASGRDAVTHVERVALFADERSGPMSALRCRLETGRTHQIRVHLASLGHPLLCDLTYGGTAALGMERQALHARLLGFRHPASSEPVSFGAAPPADFAEAWSRVAG